MIENQGKTVASKRVINTEVPAPCCSARTDAGTHVVMMLHRYFGIPIHESTCLYLRLQQTGITHGCHD